MASVTRTPYPIPDYFIVNINDYILKIIHKNPENLTEKMNTRISKTLKKITGKS